MARKGSIYFPNLLAFFILLLSVFFPHFWFVLPAAVTILHRSRSKISRLIPWLGFGLAAYVAIFINTSLTELDLLSLVLFFMEGLCLHWILRKNSNMTLIVLVPLVSGLVCSIVLLSSSRFFGLSTSYAQWSAFQINSEVFPYFFRLDDWPESLEGFYRSILLPVLNAGILAWYACMIAMAYFVNGVFESLLRGSGTIRRRTRPKIWDQFSYWKAPEGFLFGIFLALLILVGHKMSGLLHSWIWEVLGWHLLILSLFPIFIQGIAVASYFIPRVSLFIFVLIFSLLIFKPIPVLILAGLSDLWFDFRSRVRSDPG